MSTRPRPLVAGNWKMNGLRASLTELEAMVTANNTALSSNVDLLICPPFPLLQMASSMTLDAAKGRRISIGAQDCHTKESGAHTGDVSAQMIADTGATYVIVGHSERRADHAETDAIVCAKAEAARRAGLTAIICVGETHAEREAGRALDIVRAQLHGSIPQGMGASHLVIAYEPVWAIGTGLTPTAYDVAQVHALIRAELVKLMPQVGSGVRILYGGSVKPSNAVELMGVENVNGALVGGASLTAKDFLGIAAAYL